VTTNAEDLNGPNFAVSGGRAGAFPDIRPLVVAAYGRVLQDGLTPAQALNEARQAADVQIAGYQTVITQPVSPAEETSVILPGDNLAFTFGAGAIAEDVDLRYESGALNPAVEGLQGVGVNFSVTAVASGSNEEVAPTQPYTLTTTYRDVQIEGVDESTLAFYFWENNAWVREETSVVDAHNSQVTATPSHFSEWALLGRTPTLYLPVVTTQ
jgi:hypothetical protein